jgi:hypothetical protein
MAIGSSPSRNRMDPASIVGPPSCDAVAVRLSSVPMAVVSPGSTSRSTRVT